MESLEKAAATKQVEPFPLHAKYVPAILEAKRANGQGDDASEDEKPAAVSKSKKPKKPNAKKRREESDWQYGKIRSLFIETKKSTGLPYKEAVRLWDDSHEKAQILSLVSLPELRKRRFLEAGSTEKPWIKKLKEFERSA